MNSKIKTTLADIELLEKRRRKGKERQRRRRAKLTADELQKKKEYNRQYIMKRKIEGKWKSRSHMSRQELIRERQKGNERIKRYRENRQQDTVISKITHNENQETQMKEEVKEENPPDELITFEELNVTKLDTKDENNMFLRDETAQIEEADAVTEEFAQAVRSNMECVRFLIRRGLIPGNVSCAVCGKPMTLKPVKQWVAWICHRTNHSRKKTPFRGTFMEGSKMQPSVMLTLIYYFSRNITSTEFIFTSVNVNGKRISEKVIRDVMFQCREICLMWVNEHCDRSNQLGRDFPVEVVQINCGDKNAQSCILVLFEHDPAERGRFIIETCSDNTKKSVVHAILNFVKDSATVVTNLRNVADPSHFLHFRVNRHDQQLELINGLCEFESFLHLVRNTIPKRQWNADLTFPVAEFLYRRQVDLDGVDPFVHFLNAVKQFYPGDP